MTWTEFAHPDREMTVAWEAVIHPTVRAEVVYFGGDWYLSLKINDKSWQAIERAPTLEQAKERVADQVTLFAKEFLEGLEREGLAA